MKDLINFLTARLDEDEATALATKDCSCGRCDYGLTWGLHENGMVIELGLDVGHTIAPGYITEQQAAFVIRNDPKRALDEVGAKRTVLEWLEQAQEDVAKYEAEGQEGFLTGYRSAMKDVACRLASVYRDHPDWREEWQRTP